MTLLLALSLLYISQLIYEASRWCILTNFLVEDARTTQMRNAIEGRPVPVKPAAKGLIYR